MDKTEPTIGIRNVFSIPAPTVFGSQILIPALLNRLTVKFLISV